MRASDEDAMSPRQAVDLNDDLDVGSRNHAARERTP